MDISVAIPTIGRPCLYQVLKSLKNQHLGHGQTMEIIVADDSEDQCVGNLIEKFDLDMDIALLVVCSQNVAIARNACLDAARGEIILFIDDDEVVPKDWATAMYQQVIDTKADCLFAPIQPVYRPDAPRWLTVLNPIFPEEMRTGVRYAKVVGRAGNSAIRRSFIHKTAIRFDPKYRKYGEDLFFFTQCAAAGARMLATDRPMVVELIRSDYHNLSSVLSTLFHRGHVFADVRYRTSKHKFSTAVALAVWSSLKIGGSLLALPFALFAGRIVFARQIFRLSLDLGKMKRLVGG